MTKRPLVRQGQRWLRWALLLFVMGCTAREPLPLPTRAEPEALRTSIVLTRNAPPPGYSTISLPRLDQGVSQLAGAQYDFAFHFDGRFAQLDREADVRVEATVTHHRFARTRRVVAEIDNDLEPGTDPVAFEGVRISDDVFLLRDGICLRGGDEARTIAELSAGDLLGGIERATTAAERGVIDGVDVWRYEYGFEQLLLPGLRFREDTVVRALSSELWFAPQHDVVMRFDLTMEIERIEIRSADNNLPLTGTIRMHYELSNIGELPNITVPFGC